MPGPVAARTRRDRCPGALRPWAADDGLLVRLRLIGGRVRSSSLRALADVAEEYGDGRIRLTGRANLQVRGLPGTSAALDPDVLAALERTGLLPTRTHELVRNVLVSPQTGLAGGRADLRPVAAELDRLLCADAALAGLPGRFLFVLDDGRGDLVDRTGDLGIVALDSGTAQLRVGDGWGPVVALRDAPATLAGLAASFAARRGSGPAAPWHVVELSAPLADPVPPDPHLPHPVGAPPFGDVPGGRHVAAAGGLDRVAVDELVADVPEVVVTPWRGVLVPERQR
ncbi:nitrite reductase [Nocardioides sp. CER19]|uniref:nitrite reductase n=1 Tax=Nocardioides sp. CER19 TaxID=3038538 RepID=UPI0024491ADE|nr:nitrite reductase [Nocardioides sp. CER19]MDH2416040.1 nitrite reductase [Nocardioides sp. CER19]